MSKMIIGVILDYISKAMNKRRKRTSWTNKNLLYKKINKRKFKKKYKLVYRAIKHKDLWKRQ